MDPIDGRRTKDLPGGAHASAVHILYNGGAGVTDAGNVLITEATPGVSDDPEASDFFGEVLA